MAKINLLKKRRLLNSIESMTSGYLLMIFSLITSKFEYLKCTDCGLNYKFIVSLLFVVVFGSFQILTINSFLNSQRKKIKILKYFIFPLFIYFPFSTYLFLESINNLFRVTFLIFSK